MKERITKTRFYRIWAKMKERCLNPNSDNYAYYGGRGISLCDDWLKFANFYNDMYESYLEHVEKYSEKDTTLDRIDSNGHYFKENCRWATLKEQANNKSNNVKVTETKTLKEYCDRNKLPYKAINYRINHGWTLEDALNTPPIEPKYVLSTGETLRAYCKKNNIVYGTMLKRIRKGYSLEEALSTPIRGHKN